MTAVYHAGPIQHGLPCLTRARVWRLGRRSLSVCSGPYLTGRGDQQQKLSRRSTGHRDRIRSRHNRQPRPPFGGMTPGRAGRIVECLGALAMENWLATTDEKPAFSSAGRTG